MKFIHLNLFALSALLLITATSCSKRRSSNIDNIVGVYTGTMHNVASNIHGNNPYCYDTTFTASMTVKKVSADEIQVENLQLQYNGSNSYTVSGTSGESTTITFSPASGGIHYQYSWSNPGGTAITNQSSDFVGSK